MSPRDERLAPWDDPAELPESWKPKNGGGGNPAPDSIAQLADEPTSAPDSVRYGVEGLPGVDMDDPGQVEAFYGPGGFVDHLRKIVLSSCREIERAKALASGEKMTESRLDDLAHLHENYVQFIIDHLNGRRLRELNVLQSLANR
jgi:hypothetical protein